MFEMRGPNGLWEQKSILRLRARSSTVAMPPIQVRGRGLGKHCLEGEFVKRFFADAALIAHHVFDTITAEIGVFGARLEHAIEKDRLLNQLVQVVVPAKVPRKCPAKVSLILD